MITCKTGKVGFDSYRVAMKVNGKLRDHDGPHTVYRCEHCSMWHVGTRLHKTVSKRPVIEDREESL